MFRFLLDEMIRLTTKSFITHKKDESRDDCQDAWYQNENLGRYAVADGATRSFFPKEWADLLVEHFCESSGPYPTIENWKTWMGPIQEKWRTEVVHRVKERPLFYLVNSLNSKEPAISTFIGLEFDKVQGRWQAMIVGDSCLFHLNASRLKSYVIETPADFTSRPEVFASYEKDNQFEPSFREGDAMDGDTFILATDALAKWILEYEALGRHEEVLRRLQQIESDNRFQEFVDSARTNEEHRLVNDDVTLMMISVESAQHMEREEVKSATVTCSGIETETESSSGALQLLFWVLLAGILGFFVGGLLCLIFLFLKD